MRAALGMSRWAAAAVFVLVLAGCAAPPALPPPAEPEYTWNQMQGEKLIALRAKGDATSGAITFEICQGCHRAGALGRPDGTYPRLAGQHDTVLIKQMTDVRAGRRSNPRMLPFADRHVLTPQEIADVAAYLSRLPSPPNNGRGSGQGLDAAQRSYAQRCAQCHGERGEGDASLFYPRVSGQHYLYMRREMIEIRDGVRGNANPRMRQVVRSMSDAELDALSDYMSRLPTGN